MQYRTIIWVSDASTSDINYWFQSYAGEYILNGGNILLMSRYASAFINSDYENGLGIKWIIEGSSQIENCTAVYDGLIDMNLNGDNFSNSVFDTLITNPYTKVLFQDRSNPDSTLNISFLYKPEYGGRYREDGGSFVLIGGRPYRYDHSDMRTNVEYILKNFFNEDITTSVEDELVVTEYAVDQNYPNPFNPVTTIKYQLREESKVSLKVFNILGQQVTELVNEIQPMGIYKTNFGGNELASGVYFYEVHFTPINGNKDFRSIKKMLLVK
jgi:hypothetical protein